MIKVFGFYKFFRIDSLEKSKVLLNKILIKKKIRGTIIISKEGINGTVSGKSQDVKSLISKIKKHFSLNSFDSTNQSNCTFQPFHKPKVKIKKEIVPMNMILSKKIKKKDSHVDPKNWNKLIKNEKTIVIDARKPFEYKIGSFDRAINPNIKNFRDFPKYLKKLKKNKSIAMFCTGGIRCEKASVYLEKKGFNNIYQLKGGILNYIKSIKNKNSLWRGECFVFDNRVSLKHGLKVGSYSICSGCRNPISQKDILSKKYEEGVTCPGCYNKLTISQKKRFRMRQGQINLAKSTGKRHIFQKEQ
tara:strand:- start:119 stop:1024 length:906 start_codon:yes stop_codon:yes gene_type:complete